MTHASYASVKVDLIEWGVITCEFTSNIIVTSKVVFLIDIFQDICIVFFGMMSVGISEETDTDMLAVLFLKAWALYT